jgi:Cyclin, C-terminal domain
MNGLALPAKTPRKIREFCDFFMDLTVQDYTFTRYPPSLLASAVLIAARKALNIVYVSGGFPATVCSCESSTVLLCLLFLGLQARVEPSVAAHPLLRP